MDPWQDIFCPCFEIATFPFNLSPRKAYMQSKYSHALQMGAEGLLTCTSSGDEASRLHAFMCKISIHASKRNEAICVTVDMAGLNHVEEWQDWA